jgi:nucleoside-diphosphate-sugar epimerase
MNVLIIGGTGLLGLETAKELIKRGHKVKGLTLPEYPQNLEIPEGMELVACNYETLSDNEVKKLLRNQDRLIFAAGVDERIMHKGDPYEFYKSRNITPLKRLLALAKEMKVKGAIVCGSYFSYLDRVFENLYLYENNPYIKSRIDQSNEALSFADNDFSVTVLELPYIFGVQPGRKPVWVFLVEKLLKMKFASFYPRGGTAMITVNQAAQAIASATETTKGAKNIAVGYYNLTWKKMIKAMHKGMGLPNRKVITVPKWLFKIALLSEKRKYKKMGIEPGLSFKSLAEIMTRKAYIDNNYVKNILKVKPDDIEQPIIDSTKLSLDIIKNNQQTIEMK